MVHALYVSLLSIGRGGGGDRVIFSQQVLALSTIRIEGIIIKGSTGLSALDVYGFNCTKLLIVYSPITY